MAEEETFLFDQSETIQIFDHLSEAISVLEAPCPVDAGAYHAGRLFVGCYAEGHNQTYMADTESRIWDDFASPGCGDTAMVTDASVLEDELLIAVAKCGFFAIDLGSPEQEWSKLWSTDAYSATWRDDHKLLTNYSDGMVLELDKDDEQVAKMMIPGAYRVFRHRDDFIVTTISDNAVWSVDFERLPIPSNLTTDEPMYLNDGCSVSGSIVVSDRYGSRVLVRVGAGKWRAENLPQGYHPTRWMCEHPSGPVVVVQNKNEGLLLRPAYSLH